MHAGQAGAAGDISAERAEVERVVHDVPPTAIGRQGVFVEVLQVYQLLIGQPLANTFI